MPPSLAAEIPPPSRIKSLKMLLATLAWRRDLDVENVSAESVKPNGISGTQLCPSLFGLTNMVSPNPLSLQISQS